VILNTLLKIFVVVFCIIAYFLFRDAKTPRYPLFFNFFVKNLIWILIYLVFDFSHTSDLIAYKNFLDKVNSGLIPNQDFDFPYGPLFLHLFELLNPIENFIFWYFCLTLIDTTILKLLMGKNKENSNEIFWFWFFNPLNIILTVILGQNQILILFFATLALISHSKKIYRVSAIFSMGAILVKMIQFLFLPGFFVFLWLRSRKLIWLALLPIFAYTFIGLMFTPKWFVGVQNEFNLLAPGNISFWIVKIFPVLDLDILNTLSAISILAISLYCIRNFQPNENLFLIATLVTLIAFLLTNPRSYSQYWIFTLPLMLLIQDKKLHRELMFNVAILSMLVPVETSFYFNFILEKSFNNTFSWLALFALDSLILYYGLFSFKKLIRFQKL